MSSQVPGTNVPPVSFPGIASGIDYNAIITKLTSLTLSQNVSLNAQVSTLNAANAELIKINSLLSSVQSALGGLSQPNLFNTWAALSSNLSAATAQGIPGVAASPGVYVVNSATVATATSVASTTTAGHKETDIIASGIYAGQAANTVPLASSYAAITPTNGSGSAGTVTIDGVTVSYNVNTDSANAILARIQTAVRATYDASFTIGLGGPTGDTVVVSGNKPITLGSSTDQGNLLSVLKLDQAQVNNTGPGPYSVTGTSGVGGINQAAALNGSLSANFVTPVTSGTITINGVSISVDATGDNVASVLAKINASTAGVVASYNSATNQITLTSKTTGPQSIVVGSAGDSSNFLSAAGLTTAAGATTTIGTQAKLQIQNPNGSTQTYYSNSNQVTTAIPGVQINLLSNSATPYTISVSQDSSQLVSAVNTFVSAYNAAITEINNATQPPLIVPSQPGQLPANAQAPVGGGVLWNNSDIGQVKDQLTNIVSGFFGNNTSYNSLASLGLTLTDSFSTYTTSNNGTGSGTGGTAAAGSQPGSIVQTTTYQGTDGTFQALNTQKFLAALQANPSAVTQIFQGASSLTTQLGTFLTGATGLPTLLSTGTVGQIPSTAVIQGFENSNTDTIQSLQEQIKQITDDANLQADSLRQQFVSTEGTLAQYQALQSQLAGFFKGSGG